MNEPKNTTVLQELVGQVELARIRLAQAESEFIAAKEKARTAKRRKKEAKDEARRAKKKSKRAKSELADARKAMSDLEARLAVVERNRKTTQSKARASSRKRAAEGGKQEKSTSNVLLKEVAALEGFRDQDPASEPLIEEHGGSELGPDPSPAPAS